jgi:hypothetical protein
MNIQSTNCNRRSPRKPVFLSASLEFRGKAIAVRLRNISEEGALIEGDRLPAEGSSLYFRRDQLRVPATIIWVQGKYAGVVFGRLLRHEEVMRHIPKPPARFQPDFRRPGLTSPPLTAAQRKLLEVWATEATTRPLGE